jgi:uncharacterized protein
LQVRFLPGEPFYFFREVKFNARSSFRAGYCGCNIVHNSNIQNVMGLADFSKERRREVASRGGKKAHFLGKAHKYTSAEGRAAGKKGSARQLQVRAEKAALRLLKEFGFKVEELSPLSLTLKQYIFYGEKGLEKRLKELRERVNG